MAGNFVEPIDHHRETKSRNEPTVGVEAMIGFHSIREGRRGLAIVVKQT